MGCNIVTCTVRELRCHKYRGFIRDGYVNCESCGTEAMCKRFHKVGLPKCG